MDDRTTPRPVRLLGVDPGLTVTGLGVIEVAADRCRHVHHAVVRTRSSEALATRLVAIRDAVRQAALQWEVAAAAVEASFVAANARSALALGHARAAAILGLADAAVEVHEYAPTAVKQTVAGYGHGEKSQVARMVALQLGLATVPSPADAADALAIAITHWAHSRLALAAERSLAAAALRP
jgi:crossover junction endodeoxyribonuclease RuvC